MSIHLCMRCNEREATHYIKTVVNGQTFQVMLCDECFAEEGWEVEQFIPFNDMFSIPNVTQSLACKCCGETYSTYLKTGILGCPECYVVFRPQIEQQVRKIQGRVSHVGKTKKTYENQGLSEQISDIQKQIETAISQKNYLEADRLDKILTKLNKQMNGEKDDD